MGDRLDHGGNGALLARPAAPVPFTGNAAHLSVSDFGIAANHESAPLLLNSIAGRVRLDRLRSSNRTAVSIALLASSRRRLRRAWRSGRRFRRGVSCLLGRAI